MPVRYSLGLPKSVKPKELVLDNPQSYSRFKVSSQKFESTTFLKLSFKEALKEALKNTFIWCSLSAAPKINHKSILVSIYYN